MRQEFSLYHLPDVVRKTMTGLIVTASAFVIGDSLSSIPSMPTHTDITAQSSIVIDDDSLPPTVGETLVGPEKPWPVDVTIFPRYLSIPKIGLSEYIHLPSFEPMLDKNGNPISGNDGRPLLRLHTLDNGVSINETATELRFNPMLFAHSWIGGKPGTFNKLGELRKGDLVMIDGISLKREALAPGGVISDKVIQNLTGLPYRVEGKFIVDASLLQNGSIGEYLAGGICPQIDLLTSLKEDGQNKQILFSKDELSDATVLTSEDLLTTEDYLYLVVRLGMMPDTARELSNGLYRCQ